MISYETTPPSIGLSSILSKVGVYIILKHGLWERVKTMLIVAVLMEVTRYMLGKFMKNIQ